MILTENSYYYPDMVLRGPGGAAGKGGRNESVCRGNDFFNNISEASRRASEKNAGNIPDTAENSGKVSAQEEFSKNQGTVSELIGDATKADSKLSREELLQIISGHREEILKKIKNGETGVKIPIGSLWLTEEEWEKLLDSFDEVQEKIQETVREKSGEELPEKRADYFPGMKVITKAGDCKVSSGIWCRTDFPFWEYFREGTSADALNDWQPSGPQPSMLDPEVQRNLSSIGPGKISILIPEKLQARMDADPAYAEEIYRKVAKWKEDYDAWDNATAAGLGMNVAEHQLSKSYCVQLDEDGNVGNFTVVSGGGEITQSEKTVEDNWLKRRNAAILFHKRHLAKMGYTGLTGTAGIVTQEGEDSPLSLLRATLAAQALLADEKKKKN